MSTYNKRHHTLKEQLDLLQSRGLEVNNQATALKYLQRLGYYRLSGYWFPFRKLIPPPSDENEIKPQFEQREDIFQPSSKFQDVIELYVFDKKLRLLILDAIERLEVAFRVDIAYLLGEKDPFAHINPDFLHGNFTKKISKKIDPDIHLTKHQEWLSKLEQLTNRSREDFVYHYKKKYGFPLPIWVSIELWDFGLLSNFYKGMKVQDKRIIAAKYGLADYQLMESWLRSLNYLRNIAAHHSRLWNKNLVDQPRLPKKGTLPSFDSIIQIPNITGRIYSLLCIIAHYLFYLSPSSSWPERMRNLIHSFPKTKIVSVKNMGFPSDWEEHIFWKNKTRIN